MRYLLGMEVDRAIIRLLVFCSLAWLLFWGWRYATGCINAGNMRFFCPDAGGQNLIRSDYIHVGLFLLIPPLAGLLVSFWVWYSQRRPR
jgi:hypothetical protein